MNAQVVKVSRWIKRCDDSGAEYAVSECGAANFCTDMAGCVRCAEVVGSQPRGWRFFLAWLDAKRGRWEGACWVDILVSHQQNS
jgi:hypothetical protein